MTNTNTNTNGGSNLFIATLSNGFRLMDSSNKSGTQGVQTLAYSAMLGYRQLLENGKKIASWEAFIGSTKAVNDLMTALLDYAEIERPAMPKGERDDIILNRLRDYNAHCASLRRAITLAAELYTMGVDEAFYDAKKKLFTVPAPLLLGAGEEASGRLAKIEKNDESILLDGASYYIERGEKIVSVNASVARLIAASKSRREGVAIVSAKEAAETAETAPTNDRANAGQGSAKEIWKDKDFSGCVLEAVKIIKADDAPVKWSDLDNKTQNALESIRMFIEQAKALDILEPANTAKDSKAA